MTKILKHKFISDLEILEKEGKFCNYPIEKDNDFLIIGTFNPDNESCLKSNDATWFYGRKKSNFWKYVPISISKVSLHVSDINSFLTPQIWKDYCRNYKIVIIDLVKSIQTDEILKSFGDKEVDAKIKDDLSNVKIFDIKSAFDGVKFKKVIYSLTWSDKSIKRLIKIREQINKELLANGIVKSKEDIIYCLTPSRNDQNTKDSWRNALK